MLEPEGGICDDCPICLDEMNESDFRHPLQCSNGCGFNFCNNCIESLISSSKDDFGEASDGNMHVKVYLHCPNCRSDLSVSIRDTVLLRKADHIKQCSGVCDEELSASELRMRGVLGDSEVKTAIAEARKREADFFGTEINDDEAEDGSTDNDDAAAAANMSYDEVGVEADLVRGVHQSMRWPKQPSQKEFDMNSREVDLSLLSGLEVAMSTEEQKLVVGLMTSGDVSKVANAARILNGIHLNVFGEKSKSSAGTGITAERSSAVRSSVFALIDEAKHVREETEDKMRKHAWNTGQVAQTLASPTPSNARARRAAASYHAAEISIRRNMERLKRFPLPVRMPKFVEIELLDPKNIPLSLVDDTWDGTLLDAFTKISIGFRGSVQKKQPKHKGVYRILNMDADDDSFSNPRIDVDQPRILVSAVKTEAGRQGVVKGDAITHINGEEFHGSKADFKQTIRSIAERGVRGPLELILNAEKATVEALRRRAAIMD